MTSRGHGRLREVAPSFAVAGPAGTRVRTRLRLSAQDDAVLQAAGRHLGSLASADLAARCAEGPLDAQGRAASRAARKRALTAASSSRWAGAITRTTEDQWQFAWRNLHAAHAGLSARVRAIQARLAVPAGQTAGRVRGYATAADRHGKQARLQVLTARQTAAGQRITRGQVSVTRGGRRLLRTRANLDAAGITKDQWRTQWEAARLFLTADGEKDAAWGNQTIRFHPDEGWLEVRLPGPLGYLANRPHGRYRLSCPVAFTYRGDRVAAQAATGAIRYDPARGRWYLDASWRLPARPAPSLQELQTGPVLAVDLNCGHLAAWVITPDGNPAGPPVTIPLDLDHLPASQRDGRLRAAITTLIGIARDRGCAAIAVEDLDFAGARDLGREHAARRPCRGRRGRAWRRMIAGLPTGKFRDRLTQMTANAGLHVIAVDPAYTSRWGAEHWLGPLRDQDQVTTGHHAAAVVIGRRAHGHGARRRAGVTGRGQRTAGPRATPRAPQPRQRKRNSRPPTAPRQPPQWHKTVTATGTSPPDQAAQYRSGLPTEPTPASLSDQER